MLGYFYHHGIKVTKDIDKAKSGIKVRRKDHALAAANLGLIYESEKTI